MAITSGVAKEAASALAIDTSETSANGRSGKNKCSGSKRIRRKERETTKEEPLCDGSK